MAGTFQYLAAVVHAALVSGPGSGKVILYRQAVVRTATMENPGRTAALRRTASETFAGKSIYLVLSVIRWAPCDAMKLMRVFIVSSLAAKAGRC